ncbi:nucleoside phosphorylase [Ruicaihuangia caeni]|uniref:Nucleoside phosphorylase n=1 Tax=Ruicaihuangia caeni TaxID=3042517 RepID=A0AAW6T5Y5_9MICO|nr:nucleoside phosphorylase [Klugiella sp. YN-L-19]MDI2099245.1 nucleoside phosphorylase [Klugiella sp. YN-L-19]
MPDHAWYLRCGADDVGDSAVLVGDRGRVHLAAELLDDAVVLNEDRGLTTATGFFDGARITVSAFGMGAPIATVVLHELAQLGVRRFVRLGTAMTVGDTALGDIVVAHGAVRGESTSTTYLPIEYPAIADAGLTRTLESAASAHGASLRTGIFATFDGFYTEMFETGSGTTGVAERYRDLARTGVIATDMETSALFVAGRALGVQVASMCLASVAGATNDTLDPAVRREAETQLLRIGLAGLAAAAHTAAAAAQTSAPAAATDEREFV